jgi:PAS domain S-box-containing protein
MMENISQHEAQFSALFQYANEGILVADKAGTILMANPAAGKLFGYMPEELQGNKVEILLPQRIAKHHTQLRDGFNESPHARSMGTGRDLFGITKDGREFPVEVSLSPFSNEEGSFVIAFVIDITIRKKQEAAITKQKNELEKLTLELEKRVKDRTMILEEALQQLEESREELRQTLEKEKELNEMKSRFVSMASHEFRTPLATILSSLTLVSKYGEMNEKENQQRHIQRIKTSISHLTDLLNDVLSISKLEEGKIMPSPELFDIKQFTEQVIQELHPVLKKGQTIQFSHNGLLDVFVDPKFLRVILFNLISNAIKFSPENKPIIVSCSVSETLIELNVTDNGIGINDEDKEHLFERFFRGHNVTNIQGTGLGLNIVSRYLELMQGDIQVDSKINEGTTFAVTIPNSIPHE